MSITVTAAGSTRALGRAFATLLLVALATAPCRPLIAADSRTSWADGTAAEPADGPVSPDQLNQPEVAGSAVAAAAPAPAALDSASTATPMEAALLNLVNTDRAANGLPRLDFDPPLLPIARARAEAQRSLPVLSHWDAYGQLAFVNLLSSAGVDYQLAGENLARLNGPDDGTPARAEDALIRSPTHRANILEPAYNRVAVGATLDGDGHVIFAQIFRNKAA